MICKNKPREAEPQRKSRYHYHHHLQRSDFNLRRSTSHAWTFLQLGVSTVARCSLSRGTGFSSTFITFFLSTLLLCRRKEPEAAPNYAPNRSSPHRTANYDSGWNSWAQTIISTWRRKQQQKLTLLVIFFLLFTTKPKRFFPFFFVRLLLFCRRHTTVKRCNNCEHNTHPYTDTHACVR